MKIINSSVIGGKHISSGIQCEDRSASLILNDVYAVAVADGAGAKKYDYAAEGAECIVSTMTEFLCKNFDKLYETEDAEYLAKVVVSVCRKNLQKKAEELQIDDITRMSSTLLAVAVKDEKAVICHVGDGVIGKLTTEGVEFITNPDNGEFAGTTYFVTSAAAMSRARVIKTTVKDTASIFLMSDGAADYLVKDDGTFAPAATKMAKLVFNKNGQEYLEKILKEHMVARDASSDDCSYACIGINSDILKTVAVDSKPVVAVVDNKNENKPADNEKVKDEVTEKEEIRPVNTNKYVIGGLIAFIGVLFVIISVLLFGIIKNDNSGSKTTPTTVAETTESREDDESESYSSTDKEKTSDSETTLRNNETVTKKNPFFVLDESLKERL